MPEKDTEHKLIRDIIKGDSHAFDELYKQYYNKVYSFLYRYLQSKQDAEDVIQDVFITVWNSREKLKEIKNLNAWLFTITFNQIRKVFRNMAMEKRKLDTYATSSLFDDNSVISEVEFNDLMEKAGDVIERIPSRQKTVLLMTIKDGRSSTEISGILNISKRTVENHLSNARAFLKKAFREQYIIPLVILWFLL